jgi:hypothetical protein
MSKSRSEIALDLFKEFDSVLGEVSLGAKVDSDEYRDSIDKLLSAKKRVEELVVLVRDMERSGSTLPSSGGAAATETPVKPTTNVKSVVKPVESLDTCIEKLSTACKLLTETATRPVSASGGRWSLISLLSSTTCLDVREGEASLLHHTLQYHPAGVDTILGRLFIEMTLFL